VFESPKPHMICVGMGKMSQGWGEGKHASGVNDDNNIGLS